MGSNIDFNMHSVDYTSILEALGIKVTKQRLSVLECFGMGEIALTHKAIQCKVANQLNRVSLYRILDVFIKSKVLFTLTDTQAITYYILNMQGDQKRFSALLKCSSCHKVKRLPAPPSYFVRLLKEYRVNTGVLINGLCLDCNAIQAGSTA